MMLTIATIMMLIKEYHNKIAIQKGEIHNG